MLDTEKPSAKQARYGFEFQGDIMKSKNWALIKSNLFLMTIVLMACERFPNNPPLPGPEEQVQIQHLGTEYLNSNSPEPGLVADKVNVLTFEIKSNVSADAFEILGRAVMEGPPEDQEHVIHFRTDQVLCSVEGCEVRFNTIGGIVTGDIHQLIRPKFPTNEYAPFRGSQGKIKSIEIIEIWALDDEGSRAQITFLDPTK